MSGKNIICDVKGGRIRVVCARCKAFRYVPAPSSVRRKSYRCKCGKSAIYILNHRGHLRESLGGQGVVELSNRREIKIQLNDISQVGIGFTVKAGTANMMKPKQEMYIKYRSPAGKFVRRRIRIAGSKGLRIGAEFVDSTALMARKFG